MAITLVELRQLLAERFDEVTLLELLNVNSFDLVEAFSELIEDRYEDLLKEVEELDETE